MSFKRVSPWFSSLVKVEVEKKSCPVLICKQWFEKKSFLLLWQKSKWENISICKCGKKLSFEQANSIETNLWTWNLQTGRAISYKSVKQFWLNLSKPNVKRFSWSNGNIFSYWQMDIVCHFDFCHNRRKDLAVDTVQIFFNQVGHQTTYASMVNKHFITK